MPVFLLLRSIVVLAKRNLTDQIGRRRSPALYHSISERATESGPEKREFRVRARAGERERPRAGGNGMQLSLCCAFDPEVD